MHLFEAIAAVQQQAMQFRLPDGTRLWSTILKQIKRNRSFDGRHADRLLEMIRRLVEGLDDATSVAMWKETETGIADGTDAEDVFPDSARMDLEMELLDEITKLAYEEAKRKA